MDKKLIPNSTQIPNIILDFLVPQLPPAEGKCLLYISRRTYGFHKEEDRISFSQFIKGTKDKGGKQLDYGAGLARSTTNEALKNLKEAGAIFVKKDTKGHHYQINLSMNIEAVVRKVNQLREKPKNTPRQKKLFKVVRKTNQFGIRTKSGSESEPKVVRNPNPQNKGNKGNKVNIENLKKINELKTGLLKKMDMTTPQERTADQEEVAAIRRPSGIYFKKNWSSNTTN